MRVNFTSSTQEKLIATLLPDTKMLMAIAIVGTIYGEKLNVGIGSFANQESRIVFRDPESFMT
jgi:hypothetical protein